jgi:two-component system nitrogen regulation sensor histidine kinase NtrY
MPGRRIQNAEHFDKAGADWRITLRVGADSRGRPFIEVEDNGPGMAADLLEEIFIPFFTTKPEGTGCRAQYFPSNHAAARR